MAKSNFTPEQRADIAQEYLDGVGSSLQLATKYGINSYTVRSWAQKYAEQGISAFSFILFSVSLHINFTFYTFILTLSTGGP